MKNITDYMKIKNMICKDSGTCKGLKELDTKYRHFDASLSNNVKRKVIESILHSEKYVAKYRHLPFIEFPITFNKYSRQKNRYKKERIISLPSHHDALLYKIYSKILSACYENFLKDKGLQKIPIAYRKNHSNITGAKEAIDRISSQSSWIIKGDFSNFFPSINHNVLIKNIKTVLRSVEGGKLSSDWITVLRSLMNYRYITLKNIEKVLGDKSKVGNSYVKDLKELDALIKNRELKVSKKQRVGIPQGTALSAVLANVYMIEFDEWVTNYLRTFDGFYRRYSDDFIIVIPANLVDIHDINTIKEKIIARSSRKLSLVIKKSKTDVYYFDNSPQINKGILRVNSRNNMLSKSELNYLGFSFDGKRVNLRPKTIYKFRYKGKRAVISLAENIYMYDKERNNKNKNLTRQEKFIKESVDKGYSIPKRSKYTRMYLVDRPINKRNFISYAYNAQKIFSENSGNYEVNILKQARRQLGYLQRRFHKKRSDLSN
ncbi:reverse transcriptase/maturase family protein [Lactobacillaceae bacterium 24-114]